MNWYYVENGQQVGPVTKEQLEQLLQTGRITIETLVWQQGMDNWLPLRDANVTSLTPPSLPPRLSSVNLAQPVCVECGRSFPADELVTLNKSLVCAGCKPVFLQRMAEGVAT
jgi:hypothetical protein